MKSIGAGGVLIIAVLVSGCHDGARASASLERLQIAAPVVALRTEASIASGTAAVIARGDVARANDERTAACAGSICNAGSAVSSMAPAFRRCYNAGLADDPDMAGTVKLFARIGGEGQVLSVSPESPNVVGRRGLSKKVVDCVAARVKAAHFAPPAEGTTSIVIPVTFVHETPAERSTPPQRGPLGSS